MPLTVAELEKATLRGCDFPNCSHAHSTLYFHAKCHSGGMCEVSYTAGTGKIKIACHICSKVIAEIAVAETFNIGNLN